MKYMVCKQHCTRVCAPWMQVCRGLEVMFHALFTSACDGELPLNVVHYLYRYTLERRLIGSQARSGHRGRETYLPEIRPQSPSYTHVILSLSLLFIRITGPRVGGK